MIGIWNDVDRLIWRNNHVTGTSVVLPDDVEMEFGTYFWMVTALRDGKLGFASLSMSRKDRQVDVTGDKVRLAKSIGISFGD